MAALFYHKNEYRQNNVIDSLKFTQIRLEHDGSCVLSNGNPENDDSSDAHYWGGMDYYAGTWKAQGGGYALNLTSKAHLSNGLQPRPMEPSDRCKWGLLFNPITVVVNKNGQITSTGGLVLHYTSLDGVTTKGCVVRPDLARINTRTRTPQVPPKKKSEATARAKEKTGVVSAEMKRRAVAAGVSKRKLNRYKNQPDKLAQEIQLALDKDLARVSKAYREW